MDLSTPTPPSHPARPDPARPDPPRPLGPLSVGVVGTGRVGAVLAAALATSGHRVTAAYGVSEASRARADRLLPGVPLRPADDVARSCELLLLTVPDDALPGLVAGLVATGALTPGQLVVHCSGRHGLSVLAPSVAAGAQPLALHPVLPFTGTPADLARLQGAAFGVTAPAPLLPLARTLVTGVGGVPVVVDDALRPLWHAALAHGANHLVTLVSTAADLLRAAGAPDPAAVLRPLLEAALDGALRDGDAALTGPVARGDAGTVAAHLAALPVEVRPSYAALARLTAERAHASGGLPDDRAARVLEVL